MNQPTVTYFFLGANGKNGFYSLYDQFAAGPQDFLHIIKSGPGTGKSTFMKRIGAAAVEHGYDVEYILCSGDPDSLDGVYIPALHTGWVDGTAPHVLEPDLFGADGDYLNLGQFCNHTLLMPNRQNIQDATAAYKLCYERAYMYLKAAGTLTNEHQMIPSEIRERIRKRAQSKIRRELAGIPSGSGTSVKRFLRAISCKGNFVLSETLESLCDSLCVIDSHYGLESIFFEEILAEVQQHETDYIICCNPLSPDHVEAVILPAQHLCFIATHVQPEFTGIIRTIHLDAYLEQTNKQDFKPLETLRGDLLKAAYIQLSQAKKYHDRLETYYRPALQVDALNAYTENVITNLFL